MQNDCFPDEWREGVYQAIFRRRDMRHFRSDPIRPEVLAKILNAAHHAGSVGYMQPWNFIVVEDRPLRERVRAHVDAERLRAAEKFEGERKQKYLALKLEGILESALNLCVTCDPTRFGPAVLGRNTIRETDVYSTCCAIQNLWLAARAEGIGVGWVSIFEPEFLRAELGIPRHVIPVAYLCVGHVQSFPEIPMLESAGWQQRVPLPDAVYAGKWGAAVVGELRKVLRSCADGELPK